MEILIVLLVLGVLIAIPAGFILVGLAAAGRSKAKKEATKMLTYGHIDNERQFKRVSKILAASPNDLEATDLWQKLQLLRK